MISLDNIINTQEYKDCETDKKILILKKQISIGLEKIEDLTLEYKRYETI